LRLGELRPNMTLAADVIYGEQLVLLRAGQRMNAALIDKLVRFLKKKGEDPVFVVHGGPVRQQAGAS
ncbi:MAG: hypothetical protein KC616_27045, partial [Myxococcales bacterium]|nr:hypothetical protein [Myxococcales bacterium]